MMKYALADIDMLLKSKRLGVHGCSLYTGLGGIAYTAYELKSIADLSGCHGIWLWSYLQRLIDAALEAADATGPVPTWILGQPGLWTLAARISRARNEEARTQFWLGKLKVMGREIVAGDLDSCMPDELLYGRAGFLFACLWAQHHLDFQCKEITTPIVQQILAHGRQGAMVMMEQSRAHGDTRPPSPLMYTWHNSTYTGAAHGLAGIVHVLLSYPSALAPADTDDIVGTLDYLLTLRKGGIGNLPSSTDKSSDRLVQWCHGAPGLALTLASVYERLGQKRHLTALIEACDVTWERGLVKKLGLCHGIAGNIYPFLALRRVLLGAAQRYGHVDAARAHKIASESLERARSFGAFLLFGTDVRERRYFHSNNTGVGQPTQPDCAPHGSTVPVPPFWQSLVSAGELHGGDRPDSLYEGRAGVALALAHLEYPDEAAFPGYELEPTRLTGGQKGT